MLILPSATVEYISNDYVTGAFHIDTCHFLFDNVLCNFFKQPIANGLKQFVYVYCEIFKFVPTM